MKISKKKKKSIQNQPNPYQYKQIDIQKIIPNPSKSRNPKFGEIANHKRTNLWFGVVTLDPYTMCAAVIAAGWSSGAQRRGGDRMGLGVGGAVLQV